MIRTFIPNDFPAVQEIYQLGMDTKNATFETIAPNWEEWNNKFLAAPRLVTVSDGIISGWAALSPVSSRVAYAGVCEVSVYVHPTFHGRGIGNTLLTALIEASEKQGIWTLFASIFPENTASIHLHKKSGFREIGYREKIARRDGIWRNTVIFERRSKKTGL